MNLIYTLDIIGTFVFAISGTLTAASKKFDLFGAAVIAFVTAVGGGTLRDLLIGSHPVGWMQDLNYLYVIGLAVPATYVLRPYIQWLRHTMFMFDTIGIGIFTILGLQKTLSFGLEPPIAVMMGAVSAVFGGVVRDILCNEVPLIFRAEIYATACLAGGILYLILGTQLENDALVTFCTVAFVITIRLLAVRNKWNRPSIG